MIDHVSIGVRDLEKSTAFYDSVLATIGYTRLMTRASTVGYGKRYPEFWLNARPRLTPVADSGMHVCFRVPDTQSVDAFHASALERGARGDGAPGLRPEYHETYYAAFIRDFDDNLVEVVTFLRGSDG